VWPKITCFAVYQPYSQRANPDWKLTVEGHTDSIGDDAYNLDLSKRRALAVKQALVAQYNIFADRLANDGFGASRRVESNDTLEGRARNRRVERCGNISKTGSPCAASVSLSSKNGCERRRKGNVQDQAFSRRT
jgi:OmpA family